MKQPTVTIGIPACNEGPNIARTLGKLLSQRQDGWSIDRVIVMSDGSTDDTVARAQELSDPRITVVSAPTREGKATRMNQIFAMATSDICIIIDADIIISSDTLVTDLIKPMVADTSMALVSGYAEPLPPKTIVEKIIATEIDFWNVVRFTVPGAEMYFSEGRLRAFSRHLYTTLRFSISSAEDVYPYLWCAKRGLKSSFVKKAIVYYRMPATVRDYVNQMTRFLQSRTVQERQFSQPFLNRHYVITPRIKLIKLAQYWIKNPFWTVMYLCLQLYTKIASIIWQESKDQIWDLISSTKNLAHGT